MTKDEFVKMVMLIEMCYPDKPFFPDKIGDNITYESIVDEWYLHFSNDGITYDIMERAVRRYADRNKYPPTLADLKQTGKEIYLEDKDKEEYRKWMT